MWLWDTQPKGTQPPATTTTNHNNITTLPSHALSKDLLSTPLAAPGVTSASTPGSAHTFPCRMVACGQVVRAAEALNPKHGSLFQVSLLNVVNFFALACILQFNGPAFTDKWYVPMFLIFMYLPILGMDTYWPSGDSRVLVFVILNLRDSIFKLARTFAILQPEGCKQNPSTVVGGSIKQIASGAPFTWLKV